MYLVAVNFKPCTHIILIPKLKYGEVHYSRIPYVSSLVDVGSQYRQKDKDKHVLV